MNEQPVLCIGCEGNPTYPNNPCAVCGSVHVERPKLPARPPKPRRQGGDYRPHYPARQAEAYMDCIESELLAAQSRIRELKQEVDGAYEVGKIAGKVLAEVERDQLKAQVEVSDAFWDLMHRAKHILEDVEVGLSRTAQARKWLDDRDDLSPTPRMQEETAMRATLSRILAVSNDTKWFDSPCARAVREVLEGK